MILFLREINNKIIKIAYDENLYYYNTNITESIFSTFTKIYVSNNQLKNIFVDVYFGFVRSNINTYAMHIHSTNEEGLIFSIIRELEFYLSYFFNCVSLHGSAVQFNGKNILLLGKRKFGKSTLTYNLISKYNANFIDDDCVFLLENKVVGFNFPICMRKLNNENFNYIYKGIDLDGIDRFLYMPQKCVNEIKSIDLVIFPQYQAGHKFDLNVLDKSETLSEIIKNVKNSFDIKTIFSYVTNMFSKSRGMIIGYSNCDDVYKYLISI
ncbi:MAG: hypothetical protein J6S14_08655 [Clostridia bacterium]|nr:hypothetical protein [Clostridia bacterium]